LSDERIEQLREIGFVFGAIDRRIYPADGLTRGTPKTSALWSKTSVSSGDDSDDEESNEEGLSQRDEQQQETAVAPPAKRGTPKTKANNEATKTTTRKTLASEAAGVSQEQKQLRGAAEAPSDKRDTPKSITDDAEKRSVTRTRKTKASVSAERSSKAKAPDETGVYQGKRKSRATVGAPPGKRGTPKTNPSNAAQMATTRRTRTSVSAEEALNNEEPDETRASLGGEELQQTVASALDKYGSPKTNAIDAAKTKTSLSTEEASNEKDSGESEASQRKEQPRKTVVAPPGSLGIIISNRTKSKGSVVSDVRTTSVLKGKISPGDRIIAIDGEDVSHMTASEISRLIAGKTHSEKKLTLTNGATKGNKKGSKASK
jgi:hypothetical protein